MKRTTRLAIATAWIVSLISVALWAQTSQKPTVVPRIIEDGQAVGDIITGENIGFQPVASQHGVKGKVIGKWMVRVNGVWQETQTAPTIIR